MSQSWKSPSSYAWLVAAAPSMIATANTHDILFISFLSVVSCSFCSFQRDIAVNVCIFPWPTSFRPSPNAVSLILSSSIARRRHSTAMPHEELVALPRCSRELRRTLRELHMVASGSRFLSIDLDRRRCTDHNVKHAVSLAKSPRTTSEHRRAIRTTVAPEMITSAVTIVIMAIIPPPFPVHI